MKSFFKFLLLTCVLSVSVHQTTRTIGSCTPWIMASGAGMVLGGSSLLISYLIEDGYAHEYTALPGGESEQILIMEEEQRAPVTQEEYKRRKVRFMKCGSLAFIALSFAGFITSICTCQ